MPAHMVSQLVILFVLEVSQTLHGLGIGGRTLKQVLDDRGIVEKSVDIGADTMVAHHNTLTAVPSSL